MTFRDTVPYMHEGRCGYISKIHGHPCYNTSVTLPKLCIVSLVSTEHNDIAGNILYSKML